LHEKWHISLEALIDEAIEQYMSKGIIKSIEADQRNVIIEFFKRRLAYILTDEKISHDISDAVLLGSLHSVPFTLTKARLLAKRKSDENYHQIQEELTRVLNIVKSAKLPEETVDATLFQTVSEKELYEKFLK